MTDDEVMVLKVRLKLAEAWQRPANMADCPQYCKTAVAMQVEIDGLRELMGKALGALEYHREQTRPTHQSDVVMDALRERLSLTPPKQGVNPTHTREEIEGMAYSLGMRYQRTTPTAKQMDTAMGLLYKRYKIRDDSLIREIVKVLTDT